MAVELYTLLPSFYSHNYIGKFVVVVKIVVIFLVKSL